MREIQLLSTAKDKARARIGLYPLWSLVALVVLARLCGAPRGQKDLAKFAKGLRQTQRRALGVRLPQSRRSMGLLRRFSNSLFMHWRGRQSKPQHKTTTDFFCALNAEHHRPAIRCLHARQPSFRTLALVGHGGAGSLVRLDVSRHRAYGLFGESASSGWFQRARDRTTRNAGSCWSHAPGRLTAEPDAATRRCFLPRASDGTMKPTETSHVAQQRPKRGAGKGAGSPSAANPAESQPYGEHLSWIRSFLLGRTATREDAEDLAQEVWRRACRSRAAFAHRSCQQTWLHSITRHVLMDYYRSRQRQRRRRLQRRADTETAATARRDHPGASAVETRELVAHCLACLVTHLSLAQQVAVLLGDVHGFGDAEAAHRMNYRLPRYKHLLHDARRRLRGISDNNCPLVRKTGIDAICQMHPRRAVIRITRPESGQTALLRLRARLLADLVPLLGG